jgi:hypothetical protein
VGGTQEFALFCEAMKDPKHPEHRELKQWYGEIFNPITFDLDEVNDELGKYINWSRPRLLAYNPLKE